MVGSSTKTMATDGWIKGIRNVISPTKMSEKHPIFSEVSISPSSRVLYYLFWCVGRNLH